MWEQFEKQISRGVQGFGVFDGHTIFKTPKQKKIRGWLRNNKRQSDFLMFHHRMPTSTVNVRRAAHPFSTFDYFNTEETRVKYVLIHNGHVSNSRALKKAHEELGITYSSTLDDGTFNDSESLLWDVALTLEGKQDNLKAYGGIAFVCAKVVDDEITHLYFGKNAGRPLNLYREKDGILLSSEGIGDSIADHQLYTYNYKLNRLTKKYFRIPSFDPEYESSYSGSTCGYGSSYGSTSDWRDRSTHYPSRSSERNYEPIAGVDYWIDDDGEKIFFDDETWETEPVSTYSVPRSRVNLAGKSEDDLTIESYEQKWFLSEYGGKNVKVYSVYSYYMSSADGVYADAYDLMDTDLSYFAAHYKTTERDLILDLLEQAMAMLYVHEGFNDADAYDPEFVGKSTTHSNTKQTSLLIGAGQEG